MYVGTIENDLQYQMNKNKHIYGKTFKCQTQENHIKFTVITRYTARQKNQIYNFFEDSKPFLITRSMPCMSRAFKINMPDLRIANMFLNYIYKLSSRRK